MLEKIYRRKRMRRNKETYTKRTVEEKWIKKEKEKYR